MGNWEIAIRGRGIHHNGRENDAEVMAKMFVEDLLAEGHAIERATFSLTGTGGGLLEEADLLSGDAPRQFAHYPDGLDKPVPYVDP